MLSDYIRLEHAESIRQEWFVVNWCLGNTCNFSCSYCPDSLHDGSHKWPDLNMVKNFISRVMEQTAPKKVYFEFTGGEVTLYKDFTEVCKHATSLGARVGLISNGSRTIRWWEEHKQFFDHVCLSFHPEFSDENHFIKVVELLSNDIRTHINIMMSPQKFDYCYEVANKVKECSNISIALQPLIHDFGDTLFDYNDYQKRIFDLQHELISKHIKHTKSFEFYRGAMKMVWSDGREQVSAAHRFISQKINNWNGWKCWAGVEQIIVDMDGRCWRGWCKVGDSFGHIDHENLKIPTDPVLCNKTMCHCNFDIMSTKIKN
jgi:MoaA/NifB/PqqE/SkfB family radical SAM enzyme